MTALEICELFNNRCYDDYYIASKRCQLLLFSNAERIAMILTKAMCMLLTHSIKRAMTLLDL